MTSSVTNAQTANTTTSREDDKLGDLSKLKKEHQQFQQSKKNQQLPDEMVETGESSGEGLNRIPSSTPHFDGRNFSEAQESNMGGRQSVQS